MPDSHWQIREIDRSLALVGGPAAAYTHGAEWGQINTQAPHLQHQSVFYGSWQ